ncbi:MAG: class I SAM-dependent methyltransferase [Patescibacteria group bacterium]|nr:class I SAM-dependent methyltransferase [Patescibacteria group bacterium]MCL5095691.1 class I SAM-dependent methyltransferase [Patescibacteria group bacterium]
MKRKARFVNWKFCAKNGLTVDISTEKFVKENKRYYQELEDYDWVEVANRFRGLETILHCLRERETLKLVKEFGKEGKFLDVGCGTGLILRHLPPDSIGLDINPRNLRRAKTHAPQAKLVLGDIEKMPFSGQAFKAVICTDVLEHLIHPQKALSEILRVLTPKGILIGSVPAQNPIWHLRFLSSTHPGEPYHRIFKKREVQALFNNQGKILRLKRGCFGMNFFFVVEND